MNINSKKNYAIAMSMEADLREVVNLRDGNIEFKDLIREFIEDLENRDNPEYETKVKEVEIRGSLPDGFLEDAKEHFNRLIKKLEQEEKNKERKNKASEKKKEVETIWEEIMEFSKSNEELTLEEILSQIKSKTIFPEMSNVERRAIIKKMGAFIKEENKKERIKQSKIEQTWNNICGIVERESKGDDLISLKCWEEIRDKILAGKSYIKVDSSIRENIEKLLGDKIKEQEDLVYYNQVKYFTRDFSFLREWSGLANATNGRTGRKFSHMESYNRFNRLTNMLSKEFNELDSISKLLERGKIEETDKKILEQRLVVIEEERKRKQASSFGIHGDR